MLIIVINFIAAIAIITIVVVIVVFPFTIAILTIVFLNRPLVNQSIFIFAFVPFIAFVAIAAIIIFDFGLKSQILVSDCEEIQKLHSDLELLEQVYHRHFHLPCLVF